MSTSATAGPLEQEVLLYLRDCFQRCDVPRVSELADRLGASPVQFTRAFQRDLHRLPCRYFREQQVLLAKELLSTTTLTVAEVAHRAGFGTLTTFFRVFNRAAQQTPATFRRMKKTTVPPLD